MHIKRIIVSSLILLLGFPFQSKAEDSPKKKWKETAEISVVSTNGNSKASSMSGKNTFTYDWITWGLEIIGGGLGIESAGHTTAEQYYAGEKVGYKLSDKDYLFEKYRWDKDWFAGIHARHDITTGYGRYVIKTDRNSLVLELGGGYISEERIGERRNDFSSGRTYSKYIFTISETANFSQDAEYIANFENGDDYRLNTETAVTAVLSTYLSLKLAYQVRRVGDPPKGFGKTDTISTASLIFNY